MNWTKSRVDGSLRPFHAHALFVAALCLEMLTAGCSSSDAPYCFIEGDHTAGIPSVRSTDHLHALSGFYPGLKAPDWSEPDVDAEFAAKAVEFGLANDPAEEHNLYDKRPAVTTELARLLHQCKDRG